MELKNWKINDQRASGWMNNAIYISSPTGFNLARVYDDALGDAEYTAAHIVKCVNLHDELVKSVESAMKFILARHEDWMAGDFCEQLSDVLAKARGGDNA